MNMHAVSKRIVIMSLSLLCAMGTSALTSMASTTLIASTIERVDQAQQTITLRTREGEFRTFPVADPAILKKEPFKKGDVVSLEIDVNERITKIVSLAERPRSEQRGSPDQALPPAPIE
jgi:hypothetical protein